MLTALLISGIFLSAALHIRAEYQGPRTWIYVFKPLTMCLVLWLAYLGQAASPLYKTLVIAGLLFSMAGDVFLMLPSDRFVAGLIAFLIAHLFYIAAFWTEIDVLTGWPLLCLIPFGIAVYKVLSPTLGNLKAPVLLYIVVILAMVGSAWEWWGQAESSGSLLAFTGAASFVISDTLLAVNRFRRQFASARALNLSTYFMAQVLIAGSVGVSVF